jgi:hypothetical protein
MGRITDVAPAGMVPAAWLVTVGAHAGFVSARTVLVALGVMTVLLVAFLLASLGEMAGVLRVWQAVIVLGLLANLVGGADVALTPVPDPLLSVTLYAWMVLPAVAYVPTGRAHGDTTLCRIYLGSAALSLAGAVLYALGHLGGVAPDASTLAGLAAVGVGQTAGIVTAVDQNTGGRSG